MPQGQYSLIEYGKVEPSVSTLERLAKVFGISISEFFNSTDIDITLYLPLLEKIKLIDTLEAAEQQALL